MTIKKPVKLKKVMVDGKKRLEEERVEYVEEEVVVPGNVTAQIFYLKNRKPGKWQDKPSVQVSALDEETPADALSKALSEISEGKENATGSEAT